MEELLVAVGERIRSAREIQGMSQEELAARAAINNSYLSQIERGMRASSLEVLHRIGGAVGLTLGQLFSDDDEATTAFLTTREVATLLDGVPSDRRKTLIDLLRVGVRLTTR